MADSTDFMTRGREVAGKLWGTRAGGQELPAQRLAPDFFALVTQFVFGGFWARPNLDLRSRSLCTVAQLAALGKLDELQGPPPRRAQPRHQPRGAGRGADADGLLRRRAGGRAGPQRRCRHPGTPELTDARALRSVAHGRPAPGLCRHRAGRVAVGSRRGRQPGPARRGPRYAASRRGRRGAPARRPPLAGSRLGRGSRRRWTVRPLPAVGAHRALRGRARRSSPDETCSTSATARGRRSRASRARRIRETRARAIREPVAISGCAPRAWRRPPAVRLRVPRAGDRGRRRAPGSP